MSTITVAGNLGADPELRFTAGGLAVAKFTVMENRRRRNEAGEWEDGEPNVFRVQAWGAAAENVVESCRRGDRVLVVGTVATDRWADKTTGQDRTAQQINADDVAFSLRYHVVSARKADRKPAQNGQPAGASQG